ncbi:SulP family inorganic anion transporter [Acidiferrimicrobium sp. IK]|nr:SulP family inorganic anion transporter [Acidiferrimicrobium sp. IK]MCU4185869.1 SulP family inorganic anion transporter [Acidiferrimicrobium sp. IK]
MRVSVGSACRGRQEPHAGRNGIPITNDQSDADLGLSTGPPWVIAPAVDGQAWWRSPLAWRTEILAALVVGVALIPEAISFSVIAHVNPSVGLFASFTMAVTISVVGGRRAMISAATGSTALVLAPLSRHYGLHYLVAAVLLAGALQVVLGVIGIARLMRYVPRSVSVGFVNALGILLFKAQWPNLEHVPAVVYALVIGGLVIIGFFPKLNKVIPPPLIAIVVITAITILGHLDAVPTVGDHGALPHSLPLPLLPHVPMDLSTLSIIALPAATMAIVGLLETQMTARLVDDLTDTGSDKNRESWGQGIANIVTGIFGGMGGCAMIGQTMINVKSGGRTRVSTFLAGVFLLVLVVVFNPIVSRIPMAALVAVMFVVAYSTFDWASIKPAQLKRMPRSETAVMAVTVVLTVATGNLSIGVLAGVVLAALLFARRVQHIATVTRITPDHHRWHVHFPDLLRRSHPASSDGHHPGLGTGVTPTADQATPDQATAVYVVTGELFFASSSDLPDRFDYLGDPPRVVIDLTDSHIWDASTVAALDRVVAKYAQHGKSVELLGMNPASADIHANLAGHLSSEH